MTREYTMDLVSRRSDAAEPCTGCKHQYRCDAERMACANFMFFVNNGYPSREASKWPSREIYTELFHNEPTMTRRNFK